jgi:hypothetical protein
MSCDTPKNGRLDMSLPQIVFHFTVESARVSMSSYSEIAESAAISSHFHPKSLFLTTLGYLAGISASLFY